MPSDLPVTVYTPDSALSDPKRLFREMADELKNSRELSMALFRRDLKAQFRQSVLGYAWLFFPPIATTLVWFFLNSSGVVRVAETGMPYPAFVMIGSLLWQAFTESLNKPIMALTKAKPMLVKLNFPRVAPVLAGIGETTLVSAVRLVLLIPVFILAGVVPSWTILFFPFAYLSMVLLGTAIGGLLTPIGLLYTDVGRAISVFSQFAMYATPVVYPIATAGLLSWVHALNPMTYLVETGRATLVGGPFDALPIALAVTAGAFILLLLAWTIFHITVPRIIERMGM
ncbi:ABC transporter permease [Haloferula chungangensis]|uniref:Transport permease protein n=1 Tax=Haloferula chungangensis TaxID=1048331 RepID=A0ABW2L921_9BACT